MFPLSIFFRFLKPVDFGCRLTSGVHSSVFLGLVVLSGGFGLSFTAHFRTSLLLL